MEANESDARNLRTMDSVNNKKTVNVTVFAVHTPLKNCKLFNQTITRGHIKNQGAGDAAVLTGKVTTFRWARRQTIDYDDLRHTNIVCKHHRVVDDISAGRLQQTSKIIWKRSSVQLKQVDQPENF
jgi:hypothetical protein